MGRLPIGASKRKGNNSPEKMQECLPFRQDGLRRSKEEGDLDSEAPQLMLQAAKEVLGTSSLSGAERGEIQTRWALLRSPGQSPPSYLYTLGLLAPTPDHSNMGSSDLLSPAPPWEYSGELEGVSRSPLKLTKVFCGFSQPRVGTRDAEGAPSVSPGSWHRKRAEDGR